VPPGQQDQRGGAGEPGGEAHLAVALGVKTRLHRSQGDGTGGHLPLAQGGVDLAVDGRRLRGSGGARDPRAHPPEEVEEKEIALVGPARHHPAGGGAHVGGGA